MSKKNPNDFNLNKALYRWQLNFIASDLYQSNKKEGLYDLIWSVLDKCGLHPLTEVDKAHFSNEVWLDVLEAWRKVDLSIISQKRYELYLKG